MHNLIATYPNELLLYGVQIGEFMSRDHISALSLVKQIVGGSRSLEQCIVSRLFGL